jgi:uncharacterized protein YbjT (DUF2867 family)
MRPLSICVLGGTGFVGSHLVSRLVRDGHRVRVLTRHRERHRELLVLPGLELRNADVHDAAMLPEALRGHDVVINLIGILNEQGPARFRRVHAELTRTVISACKSAAVPRLLQMSALRAGEDAPSEYLRTKGQAERLLREDAGAVAWTVFRPSVIFGPGDGITNKFADLLRLFPLLPIARADARFAPVYVGDVVEAMVRTLGNRAACGATYELCGAEVLTLRELVQYVATVLGLRRLVVGLPRPAGWLQAWLLGFVPGKPLSLDNFRSLQLDSICSDNGLARLGIEPAALRAVVPDYLRTSRRAAQLDAFRRATAGRPAGT